jgi:hypothetical protein
MKQASRPASKKRRWTRLNEAWPWMMTAMLCSGAVACKEASAAELVKDKTTLAERNQDGTVHLNVDDDGAARLVVRNAQGKVLKKGVTGQLMFKAEADAEPQTVNLETDPETGILHGDGPDLDKVLTEVRYSLLVQGNARSGIVHLPQAGTKGLVKAAEKTEEADAGKGPRGGTIHVAGKQRYELVGDSESGQLRVYMLGTDVKRPKKVKLALDAERPELVELKWHADGYYVAEVDVERPPRKATLVVIDDDDDAHVTLVGYRPGVVVIVDAHPVFWVHRGWGPPGRARGHYKGTVHGPPGHNKVMVKSKHHKSGTKVQVKVH